MDATPAGQAAGLANGSASITSYLSDANVLLVRTNDGAVIKGGSIVANFGSAFADGDVLSIAYDSGAGTVDFRRNNGSPVSLSGSNVPSGPLYAATYSDGAGQTTVNFGATATVYTPPSGYSTIDSTLLNFSITTSGGVTVGGAATIFPNPSITTSGGVTVGGAAALEFKSALLITSSGGVTVGGGAILEFPTTALNDTFPPYTLDSNLVVGYVLTGGGTFPVYDSDSTVLPGALLTSGDLTLPGYVSFGDFGWFGAGDLPAFQSAGLVLAGSVSNGDVTLPAYTLDASAIAGTYLNASNTLPAYIITTSSSPGSTATAGLLLPAHQLTGLGFNGAVLDAELTAPAYVLVSVGYGPYTIDGANVLPAYQLRASVSTAIAALFRTWVLNVRRKALTEYTNFAFNSFATCGGRNFGASSQGVFELAAQDLDAAATIPAVIRTGQHFFGTTVAKRVPRIYTGYKATGAMEFRTITSADATRAYLLPWNGTADIQLRRVPINRGPKSTYWQFEVANRDGSDFLIEALELYPEKTRRRVS